MTVRASVLYDAPGPRTRRRTRISSVVAVVALMALTWWFVYRPLAAAGQFSMRLWGPFIDPSDPSFALLWKRLITVGLVNTLKAAALAIICSLTLGLALAVVRVELKGLKRLHFQTLPAPLAATVRGLIWLINGLTRVCVEVLRGMPVVITIYLVARGLPKLGAPAELTLWYLVAGLTLYNGIVIAEIVRSGIEGLPKGQAEAARSLGLSSLQTTVRVLLPQAVRIMMPAIISQLVVVVKDTSLGFIIGYLDLLHTAKLAAGVLRNHLQMYVVVGVIFIIVNYTFSRVADLTQRRLLRAGV